MARTPSDLAGTPSAATPTAQLSGQQPPLPVVLAKLKKRMTKAKLLFSALAATVDMEKLRLQLCAMDFAKLNVALAYFLCSIYYVNLRLRGHDHSRHPIQQEIQRVKTYMEKLRLLASKSSQGEEQRSLVVDAEAAKRIVTFYTADETTGKRSLDVEPMGGRRAMTSEEEQRSVGQEARGKQTLERRRGKKGRNVLLSELEDEDISSSHAEQQPPSRAKRRKVETENDSGGRHRSQDPEEEGEDGGAAKPGEGGSENGEGEDSEVLSDEDSGEVVIDDADGEGGDDQDRGDVWNEGEAVQRSRKGNLEEDGINDDKDGDEDGVEEEEVEAKEEQDDDSTAVAARTAASEGRRRYDGGREEDATRARSSGRRGGAAGARRDGGSGNGGSKSVVLLGRGRRGLEMLLRRQRLIMKRNGRGRATGDSRERKKKRQRLLEELANG